MDWADVPRVTDDWAVKVAAPALALRRAVSATFTPTPVGIYVHPETEKVGLYAEADEVGLQWVKRAAAAAGADPLFLSYQDLGAPDGCWVKVAYSPVLRRTGELLNFFPGQYPGGLPNAPSPLAAMLTSGLVGAGLGYGGGKILSALLPRKVGRKLSRTGMVLGGVAGAAPGALWALANGLTGAPANDNSLLAAPPVPNYPPELGEAFKAATDAYFEKNAETFARPYAPAPRTPMDVNINAVGQTLWDVGASPALAATTMSGLYAAQQLPDPHARPGWATANQLGQLAQNAAGDYVTGVLVGAALNAAVGTPFRATTFGAGNAALGVIGAVVPKLFGG